MASIFVVKRFRSIEYWRVSGFLSRKIKKKKVGVAMGHGRLDTFFCRNLTMSRQSFYYHTRLKSHHRSQLNLNPFCLGMLGWIIPGISDLFAKKKKKKKRKEEKRRERQLCRLIIQSEINLLYFLF